jgi:nucleoside phosphorylase
MTAIAPEYEALIARLTPTRTTTDRYGNVYTHASFVSGASTWNIAVLQAGPGNDMAAILTTHGIEHVAPNLVLFVGVAGGLKDVGVGDVVAATKIYGYESGKDARQFLPRPDVFNPSHRLVQMARHVASGDRWLARVGSSATRPRAFVQPMAAGEKVVASKRGPIFRFLRRTFSDAVAVEMEGRGFLAASHVAETQAIVIRGVSDLVDGKAKSDAEGSQKRAAQNAVAFALEMLAQMPGDDDGGRDATLGLQPRLPPPCRIWFSVVMEIDLGLANRIASALTFPSGAARAGVQELMSSPPAWLEAAPAPAWAVVGYFAQAYQSGKAASVAFERVARTGGPLPSRWLAKAAMAALLEGDQARADKLLEEAQQLGASDIFVASVVAATKADQAALLKLTDRSGLDIEEALLLDSYQATARWLTGDETGAIDLAARIAEQYPERASPLLQHAKFLLARVHANRSLDRMADLQRIRQSAVEARDRLRSWGGDSSEAVAIGCQAALAQAEIDAVFRLALEPPAGEATLEEAASFEVLRIASQAALIARRHDLVAALSSKMPRSFSAAILQAMLLKRKYGRSDTVIAALRDALSMAEDAIDQFVALYQLADLGVWPLPSAIEDLAATDPERADAVVARSEALRGDHVAAIARLRRWATKSPASAEALASTYVEAGDVQGALDLWQRTADRFNMPHLLVDAMDAANQAGLSDQAEELAISALTKLPDHATAARVHTMSRLVEIAGRRGDWPSLQQRASALRREADSPIVRWALVVALVNQGKRREAWDVICESPQLVALDEQHARVLVALQAEYQPGPTSVEAILEVLERYPDSEELMGIGLGSIYTMRAEAPLTPSVQARLNQVTEAFFSRYPESKILRKISFETVEEALAKMQRVLEPGFDQLQEMGRQVNTGQLPYGLFAAVRHRSYALSLASRDVGCIVSLFSDPEASIAGSEAVKRALNKTIVADTSALVVGAAVGSFWQKSVGAFRRILVTDSAVLDAVWAERDASARSTLSVALDPQTRKVRPFSSSDEDAKRLHELVSMVVERMRSLEQVACKEISVLPKIDAERNLPWLSPIEVAAKQGYVLWSDDACVRVIAGQLGVSSFSTYDLASVLAENKSLDDHEFAELRKALLRGLIVDLPIDEEAIEQVAHEHEWLPGPVSVALSRPTVWSESQRAFRLFERIFTRVHSEAPGQLAHWLQVGIWGGSQRAGSAATEFAGVLLGLAISSSQFEAADVPALVLAADQGSRGAKDESPLAIAVQRILATARDIMGVPDAAQFVVRVFSQLPEEKRAIVREVLFGGSQT